MFGQPVGIDAEDAKQKVCPFMDGKCVAGDCMFWRWHLEPAGRREDLFRGGRFVGGAVKDSETTGWCSKK